MVPHAGRHRESGKRRRSDASSGRDPGVGGRERFGQVDHRLLGAGPRRSAGAHRRRQHPVQGPGSRGADPGAVPVATRRPDCDDLPGPDDDAEPRAHDRHPDDRDGARASRGEPGRSAGAIGRGFGPGRHTVACRAARRLSARVLGRNAAAGGHSDGAAARAGSDHRGRTHDRA